MSSIAKTNISLSKKDLTKSRIPPVASRNVVFYHRATVGQLTINLLSLTLPSADMPTAVQATPDEISSARLSINKKNLNLVSSSKGDLIQGLDYIVVDSSTISLIGPYEGVGAESGEIFVGTINSAPISDLVVASARTVSRSYTLAIGQTTLNLAQEFQVNLFPSENIGIVKIFVNGILAYRNTGNSNTVLDKDYYEVDSGNGFGTTVIFNVAPVSVAHDIVVDFGVQAITDFNAIGTIESLGGSIKKIADDLAVVAGTQASDYYSASPSEVERRTFGDTVLTHNKILDVSIPIVTDWVDAGTLTITASTTDPAKGTAQTDKVRWRRVGDSMQIEMIYRQTTAGTSAGSGDYRFSIPSGYQIDTTKVTPYSVVQGQGFNTIADSKVGVFFGSSPTLEINGNVFVVDSTKIAIEFSSHATGSNSAGVLNSTYAGLNTANINYRLQLTVPILGWGSTQTIRQILGL